MGVALRRWDADDGRGDLSTLAVQACWRVVHTHVETGATEEEERRRKVVVIRF